MAKDKYMALADFQHLWSEKIKPSIQNSMLPELATGTVYFATCSTAATTAAKVIDVDLDSGKSFVLKKGTTIIVTFSNANTANNPTFSVAGTTAASVKYSGSVITTSSLSFAGATSALLQYSYDGTYWVYIGKDKDDNTTYSALTEADAKIGTATTARSITAEVLSKTAKGFVETVEGASVEQTIKPGLHYVFLGATTTNLVSSLTLTLAAPTAGVVNEYSFELDSYTNTSVTPNTGANITIKVPSGSGATIVGDVSVDPAKHVEFSIKYNATQNKYYVLSAQW